MRVGVFDSGIGGLSVVKSLYEHKLFEEIVYFGDTARVPYGSKDKNTIIRYAIEAVEFFKNFEIDLMVVACNSVSAYGLKEMQEVSNCPVFGVIEAGVKAVSKKLENKDENILVIGTKATISSNRYHESLKELGYNNINSIATPLFVPIVEEGMFGGEVLESAMRYYFKDLKQIPEAVILGCTHFPLISDEIKRFFQQKPVMIHSGEAIVEFLKERFELKKEFEKTDLKFFASDNPDFLKSVAKEWLKVEI